MKQSRQRVDMPTHESATDDAGVDDEKVSRPAVADPFLYLPEIALQFGKSVGHLRKVAEAQHGCFTRKRFSNKALASYPQFQRGPGRRWGAFQSVLTRYWSELRDRSTRRT